MEFQQEAFITVKFILEVFNMWIVSLNVNIFCFSECEEMNNNNNVWNKFWFDALRYILNPDIVSVNLFSISCVLSWDGLIVLKLCTVNIFVLIHLEGSTGVKADFTRFVIKSSQTNKSGFPTFFLSIIQYVLLHICCLTSCFVYSSLEAWQVF